MIDRKDGKVLDTKYISQPFVFFHTVNAFEDNNQIVVDICCYSDGKVISSLTEQHFKDVLHNHQKEEGKVIHLDRARLSIRLICTLRDKHGYI